MGRPPGLPGHRAKAGRPSAVVIQDVHGLDDRAAGGPVKALALDFDGVISDSAREAFVVALRTHRDLNPASRLPELADDSPRPEDGAAHLYASFLGPRSRLS